MTNRTLLFTGIAIVLALTVGWFSYWSSSRESAKKVSEPSGNAMVGSLQNDTDPFDIVISFDGEDFSPREITIKKGTRVRFLNTSDTEVWPASAIHPTHTLYPESETSNCLGSSFDSCAKLKKDEYFDFTFQHVGEWRYHDHIRAYKTGVVTVEA